MLANFILLLLRGLQLMAFVCFSVRWWFSYVSTANCVSYWIFFWWVFLDVKSTFLENFESEKNSYVELP